MKIEPKNPPVSDRALRGVQERFALLFKNGPVGGVTFTDFEVEWRKDGDLVRFCGEVNGRQVEEVEKVS